MTMIFNSKLIPWPGIVTVNWLISFHWNFTAKWFIFNPEYACITGNVCKYIWEETSFNGVAEQPNNIINGMIRWTTFHTYIVSHILKVKVKLREVKCCCSCCIWWILARPTGLPPKLTSRISNELHLPSEKFWGKIPFLLGFLIRLESSQCNEIWNTGTFTYKLYNEAEITTF